MDIFIDWLTANATLISSLATLVMAGVWVFYASLLYNDFRSRHYARVMIHQAPDMAFDSVCLVINTGQRMINVAAIIAVGHNAAGVRKSAEITNYRQISSDNFSERELTSLLKQGPLAAGNYFHLGSFSDISSLLTGSEEPVVSAPGPQMRLSHIEIRVVVFSGQRSGPKGARRNFLIARKADQRVIIRPETIQTIQMTSYWKRKKVRRWLSDIY